MGSRRVGQSQAVLVAIGINAEGQRPVLAIGTRMGIDWRQFAEHFPRIEARFASARITLGL